MSKTLSIYLAADVKQLVSGLKKGEVSLSNFGAQSDKTSSGLSNAWKGALIGATAAAGAFALKVGVDAVGAASDLSESINKSQVIFGKSSANILEFAKTANSALGQTQQQAIDAAATFAQFGKAAGLAGGDLTQFSTQFVTLAADLASFNNSTPEEAITALGAALRGESEPLRRFGVNISDAALRQEAATMKIYDGSGALTDQQKVLAAHSLILKKTTDQQGDFERTSDGLANQMRILKASVGDLSTSFGKGFLEGMGAATGGVGDFAKSVQNLQPSVQGIGAVAGRTATGGLGLFGEILHGMTTTGGVLWTFGKIIGVDTDAVDQFNGALSTTNQLMDTAWMMNDMPGKGVINNETRIRLTNEANLKIAAQIRAAAKAQNGTKSTTAQTEAEKALTKELERQKSVLNDLYDTQLETFNGAKSALQDATTALEDWNSKISSFSSDLQGKILSGTSLSDALTAAGTDASKEAGKTTAEIFTERLQKSIDFGRTLKELQASGAKDNLIQQVAAIGPEAGLSLAQELIDKGLVPGLQSKLDQAEEAALTVAQSLVPPFLIAGRDAAQSTLLGAMAEFDRQKTILEAIGAAVGKTIGNAAAKEIADAIAAAYKAMGTNAPTGTASDQTVMDQIAAGASAAAAATIVPNAIGYSGFDTASYVSAYLNAGQDIGRVILQSNNRNGWWETPTISPVLQ